MSRDPVTFSPSSIHTDSCAPAGLKCLVLVPAFNEGESVRKLVLRLQRTLPGFDVLVIDDGSTDDTVRQVPAGTAVVTLPFNLGIGGAMQAGYRYAALHGYDIAVQVDGDGQHRPREVRRLVQALIDGKADLVVGSRFLERNRYRQTAARTAGGWFLRGLIHAFTGLPVSDVTSGFRATSRRVIRAFAHWYPEDYPEPEVILLLHRAGYVVRELSVQMRQRKSGRSSINLLEGLFYVAKVTVCLILDLSRSPWPQGKVLDAGQGTAQDSTGLGGRTFPAASTSASPSGPAIADRTAVRAAYPPTSAVTPPVSSPSRI